MEQLGELFVDGRKRKARDGEEEKEALFEEIGRLKVELDWLKKKLVCSSEDRRRLVEWGDSDLSLRRQCQLLGVNRASLYYESVGESEENLLLRRRLDEQYTRTPFYGSRRMTAWLRGQGYEVNRKRLARLLRLMGLEAIYPKPKLSQPDEGHKIYAYLVAVIDWFSRFVLSWALSVSLELPFCLEALEGSFRWGRPDIFNSDQGSQFSSEKFTGVLEGRGIAISMDGRGRCLDNIFSERLWRSLKYEEVYLRDYRRVPEARANIGRYFQFYNYQRPHQSLEYRTPAELYTGRG